MHPLPDQIIFLRLLPMDKPGGYCVGSSGAEGTIDEHLSKVLPPCAGYVAPLVHFLLQGLGEGMGWPPSGAFNVLAWHLPMLIKTRLPKASLMSVLQKMSFPTSQRKARMPISH